MHLGHSARSLPSGWCGSAAGLPLTLRNSGGPEADLVHSPEVLPGRSEQGVAGGYLHRCGARGPVRPTELEQAWHGAAGTD